MKNVETKTWEKYESNNNVRVTGELAEGFRYSHTVKSENFYEGMIKVQRLSGEEDLIPVIISEVLFDDFLSESLEVDYIEITGNYRTHNLEEDGKRKMKQYLFVSTIRRCNKEDIDAVGDADINEIYLTGYICKGPVLRSTPAGLDITDLILAVNRNYWKSDYIPCIAWNKNALLASKLKVGDQISIFGRMQSRNYFKKNVFEEVEIRRANEISIISLEKVED